MLYLRKERALSKYSGVGVGVKSVYESKWPIKAGAYPGFCSMKPLGVFLLPPG